MNIKSLKVFVALILLINTSGIAQIFPVEAIKYNGSPDKYLNIVVMGDGYTVGQQNKFIQDATKAVNGFLNQEPFKSHKDSINVFAIKVVSNVEGASMDPDKLIDNYFGSSYWSYDIERLLVSWHTSKIRSVLNANTPFYDEAAIIVNHTKYGGSGGEFAVLSTHSSSVELLLHEFGHSFGDLADEYWAGDQYAGEYTNMTKNNNPATVKWKDFLNVNGVGIFPHEESPSWFRPHQDCKMRFLGSHFCEVCKNKMKNDIQDLANEGVNARPIAYFAADETDVTEGTSIHFSDFSTNSPNDWEWTFEGGTPANSSEQNPSIAYGDEGTYKVTLTASNSYGSNSITKTDYITVTAPLSTNDIDYSQLVSIYPNPVKDYLNLSVSSKLDMKSYRIYNSTGMLVKRGGYTDMISVSEMKTGIYIIQLDFATGSASQKFMKE